MLPACHLMMQNKQRVAVTEKIIEQWNKA